MVTLNVDGITDNERLDVVLADQFPKLSRSFIQKLCKQGNVWVNGTKAKPGLRLHKKDKVLLDFTLSQFDKPPKITLPVLYEDEDCVVINKPIGLLAHSKGAYNPEPTVATWLQNRVVGLSGDRGGIVHRLDRATSGVMICAKNPIALSWLQKQFSQRKVKKEYIAIIDGTLQPNEAIIDIPIERNPKLPATFRVGSKGKYAKTHYQMIKTGKRYSSIKLIPETGRTHQLRVHLAHLQHPIIGDILYGGEIAERMFLHAQKLEITLPSRVRRIFIAKIPSSFNQLINKS